MKKQKTQTPNSKEGLHTQGYDLERQALLDKVSFRENELIKLLEDIKQDVKDWYYYNIDQIDSFDGSEKELQKKYAEDIFDRYQRIQTTIKNYYGNKVA